MARLKPGRHDVVVLMQQVITILSLQSSRTVPEIKSRDIAQLSGE